MAMRPYVVAPSAAFGCTPAGRIAMRPYAALSPTNRTMSAAVIAPDTR